MRVTVIGSGYVGLVVGACLSDSGNHVVCVDHDLAKVQALKQGIIPIYEPGLEDLVKRGVSNQLLHFTQSTAEAVADAEIIFLAVGTPSLPTGEPNLSYLKKAAEEVGQHLTGPCLIVNKSTVPIGCHELTAQWISKFAKHPFDVVSNPEFLKEGSAVDDFLKPDRVIIGTHHERVFLKMQELYGPFVRQGNPILWMDPLSAEITKYACNSFLATRVSFMNELATLCDKVGGDIEEVRRGMISDVRIGKHFLYAGAGYGGSCFPKDIQALLATGRQNDIPLGIVEAAEIANERQKRYLTTLVKNRFGQQLQGKTFAVWGLSFKPNTDDMRDAPSLVVISELLKAGAAVQAYDPVATENAKKILGNTVHYSPSAYKALEGADALIIVTEWNEFRNPDFNEIKALLKTPILFDGRNIFNPPQMEERGFEYYGIGRGTQGRK